PPRWVREGVGPAPAPPRRLGGPVARGPARPADRRERRRHAMRRAELGRQPLQTVCPPRPEYQVRPFGREPPGARLADPGARSGDENQLSLDPVHPTPTSLLDAST